MISMLNSCRILKSSRSTLPNISAPLSILLSPRHVLIRTFHQQATYLQHSEGGDGGSLKDSGPRADHNTMHFSTRQFMITVSSGSTLDQQSVIHQVLKRSRARYTALADMGHQPSVAILTTPSFATWLEDGKFIPKLLEVLFSNLKTESSGKLEVTALLAVVDGLPPPPNVDFQGTNKSLEGFAFLIGKQDKIMPGLLQTALAESFIQEDHQQANIAFVYNSGGTPGQAIDLQYTLPLANTLFRNGRKSTLLVSKWRSSTGLDRYEIQSQVGKTSQLIETAFTWPPTMINETAPLTILTPPRRVEAGLGNILKLLANKVGKSVPASQELEATVDAYLETRGLGSQAVTVWALVVPKATLSGSKIPLNLVTDETKIQSLWTSNPNRKYFQDSTEARYVGSLIQKGARLHRVLSGGGGWGVKQGLLSLDPDTSLAKAPDARFDFDTDELVREDEQARALGDVAEPGSLIQFLIADTLPVDAAGGQPLMLPSFEPQKDSNSRELASCVLGCIPSTIDNIPIAMADPTSQSGAPVVQLHEGHFGAQSEAGYYRHSSPPTSQTNNSHTGILSLAHVTKIDVPHASMARIGPAQP